MKNEALYLLHLGKALSRIAELAQNGERDFFSNPSTSEAMLYNFMIAGEAANKVDKEFQKKHSDLNWKGIIGFRHVVVHGYDRVCLSTVWQIATDDAAEAKKILVKMPEYKAALAANRAAEKRTKQDLEEYGLSL